MSSKILRVGFTGTQEGMSSEQKAALLHTLTTLNVLREMEFHHGDCIGADAEAHKIAKSCDIDIIIHPPLVETKRAFCEGFKIRHKPAPYIARNHDIVDACDLIIVAPRSNEEELRSGTWATYRYADKANKSIILLSRDSFKFKQVNRTGEL